MPVGGPPPPAGQWPDPVIFTSAAGFSGPGTYTHSVLVEIDQRLTIPSIRWETLKRLRVMRLSLDPGLSAALVTRTDIHTKFPRQYYRVYADPRLSTLFSIARVSAVRANRPHLDLDWFGQSYVNWWPGNPSGSAYHLVVAEQLQYLLENSYGLQNSKDPAGNGSADPQYWTWGATKYATWQQDLDYQLPPSNPAQGPVMTLEWHISAGNPNPPTALTTNNVLVMSSQMPAQPNGIQLA